MNPVTRYIINLGRSLCVNTPFPSFTPSSLYNTYHNKKNTTNPLPKYLKTKYKSVHNKLEIYSINTTL